MKVPENCPDDTAAIRDANARTNRWLKRVAAATAVVLVALNAATAFGVYRATTQGSRQSFINDLDVIEHRIAEKERARCEEQFIKEIVKVIRTDPDPEAAQRVQGCFGPEQATALRDLYAKRDSLQQRLEERP